VSIQSTGLGKDEKTARSMLGTRSSRGPPDNATTVTIPDFAKISGLGTSTIYKLFRTGEVRTVRVGCRRLVIMDSWRAYIAAHAEDKI
jgi:hypothetical protein